MENKVCSICNQEKPITSFYFRKDGNRYRTDCKECGIKRGTRYATKNAERVKLYQKDYNVKNRDVLKKQHHEYFKRTYIHKGFNYTTCGFKKGHVSWHKGKTGVYSEDTLEKMSIAKKGKVPKNFKLNLVKCIICGKEFHRKPSHVKKYNYCSPKCLAVTTKIRMSTPEMKDKMRNIAKNRIYTREYRLKCSARFSGENHPQWKGGITQENKRIRGTFLYKEWREKVFKRDNWTCQMCDGRSAKGVTIYLHPHHIKSFAKYPTLRFVVSNGITLCKDCHLNLHRLAKNVKETKSVGQN